MVVLLALSISLSGMGYCVAADLESWPIQQRGSKDDSSIKLPSPTSVTDTVVLRRAVSYSADLSNKTTFPRSLDSAGVGADSGEEFFSVAPAKKEIGDTVASIVLCSAESVEGKAVDLVLRRMIPLCDFERLFDARPGSLRTLSEDDLALKDSFMAVGQITTKAIVEWLSNSVSFLRASYFLSVVPNDSDEFELQVRLFSHPESTHLIITNYFLHRLIQKNLMSMYGEPKGGCTFDFTYSEKGVLESWAQYHQKGQPSFWWHYRGDHVTDFLPTTSDHVFQNERYDWDFDWTQKWENNKYASRCRLPVFNPGKRGK